MPELSGSAYPILIVTKDLFQSFMNCQVNNKRLMPFHDGHRFSSDIRIP